MRADVLNNREHDDICGINSRYGQANTCWKAFENLNTVLNTDSHICMDVPRTICDTNGDQAACYANSGGDCNSRPRYPDRGSDQDDGAAVDWDGWHCTRR